MWITVQQFLSPKVAIFEVEFHTVKGTYRCNCPGYQVRATCKHVTSVLENVDAEGNYKMELSTAVSTATAEKAAKDPKAMHAMVVRHAKVKVS